MRKLLLVVFFLTALFLIPGGVIAQESQTVTTGDFTKPVEFPGGNCVYRWTNSNPFVGLSAAGGTGNIAPFKAINTLPIPVVATFTAEPVASDFAYVPVSSTNSVSVISIATHSVVANIPVGNAPSGVAVNPQGTLVYVTNADANAIGNTVSVISTATNKVVAGVFVGEGPRGIVVGADGSRVYVANSNSDNVSVIDAANNYVIATIPTGQTPVGMVISPDGSKLYVANTNGGSVSVIALSDNSVIATIPIEKFSNFLAVSPDGKTLYATNGGGTTVTVINAITNSIIKKIEVGSNSWGIAISPDGSKAYVALTTGATAIIDLVSGTVSTRSTPSNPQTIAIAPDGTIYITDAAGGNLNYYNADFSYGGQIHVGAGLVFGNFIKKSQPCTASPVTFTITVNPASTTTITNGPVSGDISACIGAASASPFIQQFKVSGTGLTDNITATAPTGFELSLAPASGYGNSVSVPQSGGKVSEVRVYVRSAATANSGYISGSVALASAGTPVKYVGVNGWVNKLPAVNNPDDKFVAKGETLPVINLTGTANIYRWTNDNPSIGLAASGEGDITSFTAINTGSTPVVANIRVTPVPAQLAYISNYNDNTVSVVDIAGSRVLTTIPVGKSPTGIAVARDGSMVFVANYDSDNISVISTFSNKVINTIAVGKNPSAVAVSTDGSKLYVANNGTNKVAVISTSNFQTLDIITVGENPDGLAVSHDGTRLYVLNYSSFSISVVDVASNTIVATMTGINGAVRDICISPDDSRLYVSINSFDNVLVFSTVTNTLETKIPAPGGLGFIGISPDGNTLYGGSGQVLDIPTGTKKTNTFTSPTQSGLALSADGQLLIVPIDYQNNLLVVNVTTNAVVSKIAVGKSPFVIGNFIKENPGCDGQPIDFKITVNPTLTAITTTAVTGKISACVGSASVSPNIQQFKVLGTFLTEQITATAPAGFELSLSAGSAYGNAVSIPQSGGKVTDVIVYVRSAASAPLGYIQGNVSLTSGDAPLQNVNVSGYVNELPFVNNPGDKTVDNGAVSAAIVFEGTGNFFEWTNDNPSIGLAANGVGDIASFMAINTGKTAVKANIKVTPVSAQLGYVTNFNSNDVSVINTANNSVIKTIPVGTNPVGVAASRDGSMMYVTNTGSGNVSAINTFLNKVTYTIGVGYRPTGIVMSPDGLSLYVTNFGQKTVSVIATLTQQVVATFVVGENPNGITISHDGKRLYVVNYSGNSLSVVNTGSKTVIATIPIGDLPQGICISPDDSRVYVVNENSGSVLVINTATNKVIAEIPVGSAPENIAIKPDGSLVYVTNVMSNTVSVISTVTNSVIASIPTGNAPMGVTVSSDGTRLFVANTLDNSMSVINTANNTVVATIPVGDHPYAIGNFIKESTGCPGVPVDFSITVNPTVPLITATPATGTISVCTGNVSAGTNIQQFNVSGINLSAGITGNAPAGFEISLTATGGYGATVTMPHTNGKVNDIIVYVRSAASNIPGAVSGDVILSSVGAENIPVRVAAFINALPTVNDPGNQSVVNGAVTTAINFTGTGTTFTWINNTPSIGLAASGTGNIGAFTAQNTGTGTVVATITIISQNQTCTSDPVSFTITVNPTPPPTLSASGTLLPLTTVYGTSSSSESFTVSGTNIISGISIAAPAGFEVSTDNLTFSSTAAVAGTGTIPAKPVYIRLTSKAAVGTYGGDILVSVSAATSATVVIPNSTVTPAPLMITADNKAKAFGEVNPALTVSYSGFVNNDNATKLTRQPSVSTSATTTSEPGDYAIIVSDAAALNYTLSYLPGVLTIKPAITLVAIPNTFTPNGDGVNDTWNLSFLQGYPKATVSVLNRWGDKVYSSIGYAVPWDGKYKDAFLPSGTYYYVINPKDGQPVISGWVALIR
ncbi:beta-propeller fold lactonase family protein [Mucilaginibacter sp. ZT4R22]|uniref:Beta-propeller fold lactonase family protein n=1 Tax=Mucilaginibacter pankratovii TaxID=2772110 RepID=A0ABR7WNY8_9SPHI|nr:beta-propeller fold lactonase family protein [Mucilaginibacter pankratovii]MBD1363017.1 beta-propeller fold lactonase family protein [Mucilaginibacter pankratovii]